MVEFDGKKLRRTRKAQGVSQALLAERIDSSIRYIRALEVGEKSNPSAKMMYRISNVLETPMEDFMSITTDPKE